MAAEGQRAAAASALPENIEQVSFVELLDIARKLDKDNIDLQAANSEKDNEIWKLKQQLAAVSQQVSAAVAAGPSTPAGSKRYSVRARRPSISSPSGATALPHRDKLIAKLARKALSAIKRTAHTAAKKPHIYTVCRAGDCSSHVHGYRFNNSRRLHVIQDCRKGECLFRIRIAEVHMKVANHKKPHPDFLVFQK